MPSRLRFVLPGLLLIGCTTPQQKLPTLTPDQLKSISWTQLLADARGTEVAFAMWSGDEERNRHFRGTVTDACQRELGIKLRIVPFADTSEIVNKLLNEKSARRNTNGSIDLLWVNGENFRTARDGKVLWGPFADVLPNSKLYADIAKQNDFGTPVEGLEAPWLRAQFVFAYNSARVPKPPESFEELKQWVQSHPGRFTYIAPPDFTGSAFVRHVLLHFGDGQKAFQQFDEAHYQKASSKALAYLREIRPFLWSKGETYPTTQRQQDSLYANGETDFAMNYSPAFATVHIAKGEFPASTRTFVMKEGTIANYSYLAIPFNAQHPTAAVVAANFLMSFEQVLEHTLALQSPFAHDLSKLTQDQRNKVNALPRGIATLPDGELAAHALSEPHAEYLTRFEKDWQEKVLRP